VGLTGNAFAYDFLFAGRIVAIVLVNPKPQVCPSALKRKVMKVSEIAAMDVSAFLFAVGAYHVFATAGKSYLDLMVRDSKIAQNISFIIK
jgi:hypothetical protein